MAHDGNGRFKIIYWNGSSWIDWITDIPTTTVNAWGEWIDAPTIITTKIQVIATILDTRGAGTDSSMLQEIELKH